MTTAKLDTPKNSTRFEARVVKVVDADTVKIEHDGTTQVVDLAGIQVPGKNASTSQFEGVPSSKQGRQLLDMIHKRAFQTTKIQLGNQVVTVATNPAISKSRNGRQHVYVYISSGILRSCSARAAHRSPAASSASDCSS